MTPQPGWYPDPEYANTQRWWDGSAWTEKRNPPLPREARPRPPAWQRYVFLAVMALVVALVVFGLISANNAPSS